MEDCGSRRWDELFPDALGLIFKNLSLQELLVVIPRVCKSWRETVLGPYCWQEIDIMDWSLLRDPVSVITMLQLLISRSSGYLHKLCISSLPNDSSLSLIAKHGKALHTLRVPRSEITNSTVEQVADKLSAVTFLDLSFCKNIGAPALEAIGKHCVNLIGLRRVMCPFEAIDRSSQDDEAIAIASTMHKVKQLEIAYLLINTESVLKILENCPQLEYLDVQGCWHVILDERFKKFSKVKLIGPLEEFSETIRWDGYSDSSSYLVWEFVADELDDQFDMLEFLGEDYTSVDDEEHVYPDWLEESS
ncbi:F-box protein FBW2 [Cucumis sativus]|uniref:F-box domain-containing protein n=1 Tax=Cucumis sativus TaxID=3659 RepID=A0A0A0L0J6_CUCSA|nr:F-box protein FBW2 [Cucumis sativus]XP_011653353.1 F-box protein FBW2 [Cucumis sativus]KGN53651.1 hypothetical protein Csa_014850 [Cucumis sativus]